MQYSSSLSVRRQSDIRGRQRSKTVGDDSGMEAEYFVLNSIQTVKNAIHTSINFF